jgi:SAM-dependent MidA family methyltransferase
MTIAAYMAACLYDPTDGYYATRPRLGADGDFITAPHVSQMFGELLGLWAVEIWSQMGSPRRLRLVELGPGDGTLMSDILRALRAVPACREACEIWLVDISEPLRAAQKRSLAPIELNWADSLEAVPSDIPAILISNELLDCFPIRQAVATAEGWRERLVGLDRQGALSFTLGPAPASSPGAVAAGRVFEWSDALAAFGTQVGAFLVRAGGAGVFIDYGREGPGFGDTLQALRDHAKVSPLDEPGHADLTAHVDFPAFLAAARRVGARTSAIATQADFLWSLGLGLRAKDLAARHPDQAAVIGPQV